MRVAHQGRTLSPQAKIRGWSNRVSLSPRHPPKGWALHPEQRALLIYCNRRATRQVLGGFAGGRRAELCLQPRGRLPGAEPAAAPRAAPRSPQLPGLPRAPQAAPRSPQPPGQSHCESSCYRAGRTQLGQRMRGKAKYRGIFCSFL